MTPAEVRLTLLRGAFKGARRAIRLAEHGLLYQALYDYGAARQQVGFTFGRFPDATSKASQTRIWRSMERVARAVAGNFPRTSNTSI